MGKAAAAHTAKPALKNIVILDLMRKSDVTQTLAGALQRNFDEFASEQTLPPIYEIYTDWTYTSQWSDPNKPIRLPASGACDPALDGHASIAGRLKAHAPETILLVAQHFFSDLSDKDLNTPTLGLELFNTARSAKALAAQDMKVHLKTNSSAQIVIYDPILETRKTASVDALVKTRTAEFAKELGVNADRIVVVTTPEQVVASVQSKGRAKH